MKPGAQIAKWAEWSGWRRIAPTAGSLLVNVTVLVVVGGNLAAGGMEPPKPRPGIAQPLTVTLVAEIPPLARPEPPDLQPAAPRAAPAESEVVPVAAALPRPKERKAAPSATAPSSSAPATDDETGVYVGPPGVAQIGPPLGLQGLLKKDPCNSVPARMRGDCDSKWGKMLAEGDIVQAPSAELLARLYPGFGNQDNCQSIHMGCPDKTKPWVSSIGTHSVGVKGPMAGGPGSLAGMNETVGRLGPKNDYQRDPGFGD
jgi:hypothetical protein